MKKLKYVLITLFACLFCFLFASCAEATYVEDSFTATVDYQRYGSMEDSIKVDGSFKVELPSAGNYSVSFFIEVVNSSNEKVLGTFYTKTISGLGEQTVSIYKYFDSEIKAETDDTYTAKIYNVKIKKEGESDDYKSYAIGFGVTGGALLLAATVFFAVTKAKEKN